MEPKLIADHQCVVGEGPLWHEDEQRVYWTDIVTGRLFRYGPDGSELQRIRFPARKVSSAIFGGPDLTDLYVTTAGGHQKEVDGPGAGALFRVRPGVRGVREFRSRVGT